MKRREFVNGAVAAGALTATAGMGLLRTNVAIAASRPDEAFLATDADEVLNMVFGTTEAEESADVKIDAPLQAENGAVVPVQVSTTIAGAEMIAVVVKKNPTPLLTLMETTSRTGSYYSLRVKMAGTDKVYAYVKAGGKLYMASQDVRVAVGGCGG